MIIDNILMTVSLNENEIGLVQSFNYKVLFGTNFMEFAKDFTHTQNQSNVE